MIPARYGMEFKRGMAGYCLKTLFIVMFSDGRSYGTRPVPLTRSEETD